MEIFQNSTALITSLNELVGGLFIISTFGIVATRQVRTCLKFFIFQSALLALSAFLLGIEPLSKHLIVVGIINLITKVWILPHLLRRQVNDDVYVRREISQVFGIPTSLLITLALTIAAYYFSQPLIKVSAVQGPIQINLPIGLTGLLLGAYTLTNRREAIPQLMGLLAMENGAFFAGISIAPELPFIAEVALAFDILVLVFVAGILTQTIQERIGTTAVGKLSNLREEAAK